MIDDRIEEGFSEDEAVEKIRYSDDISKQISIEKHIKKSKRVRKPWEIALLWIGSPLWISLALAAFAIVISLYASLWAAVVSFWSAFVALAASGIAGVVAAIPLAIFENAAAGFAIFGAGAVCLGVAIFAFYGCKAATKGAFVLTRGIARGIGKCFGKKEKHNERN
jgi:uncharacterized membrane protein